MENDGYGACVNAARDIVLHGGDGQNLESETVTAANAFLREEFNRWTGSDAGESVDEQ